MELECRPIKEITLPISDSVDITEVKQLVDSSPFQRLRRCRQLGAAEVAYPNAVHTRFVHSLGTYDYAIRRTRRLEHWKQLTSEQGRNVRGFALVHDIGHGPLSHITDTLVLEDHEERAISILASLRPVFDHHGIDTDVVINMMKRSDPLAELVIHSPLGVDKLNYLDLDSLMTGVKGMLNVSSFLDHVFYLEDQLIVDPKIFEEVWLLSDFYRTMYARVYHRTSVVVTERFLQHMLAELLGFYGDEREITEAELVAMTDSDMDYTLSHAKNPQVKDEYARYFVRNQPYPALAFRHSPYFAHHWSGLHKMKSVETPSAEVLEGKRLRKPMVLWEVERAIEGALGLPERTIMVASPVSSRRFMPHLVKYITNEGIKTNREMEPERWDQQCEEAKRYAVLYVCTALDNCQDLIDPHSVKVISDTLHRFVFR